LRFMVRTGWRASDSYKLAFWAAPLDTLVEELTRGGAGDPPEKVYPRARAILKRIGKFINYVAHISPDGESLREEYIGGKLGGLIGAEAAGFLLERDLAGIRWTDTMDGYPSMGWLTKADLVEVIAKLGEAALVDDAAVQARTGLDVAEAEALFGILCMLRAAGATGQDLVTTCTQDMVDEMIMAWRQQHKGVTASEIVECQRCEGRLLLFISAVNGHVHAQWKTDRCVAFIE
jgi:hypothetical protein